MINVLDVMRIAVAADSNVSGVSLLAPGQTEQDGWVVVALPDGARIRVDGVAPDSPAIAAVAAADFGPQAESVRTLAVNRIAAFAGLLARNDETAIGVRAVFATQVFLFNNRIEFLFSKVAGLLGVTPEALAAEFGAPTRVLQSDIFACIMSNPMAGDPNVGQSPPANLP